MRERETERETERERERERERKRDRQSIVSILARVFDAGYSLFYVCLFVCLLFEAERTGKGQREGEIELEAGSRFQAVSTEPDAGLKLTDCEIMT